jgi:hypothetical protein
MMVKYFWEDVENRMKLMKMDDRNLQADNSRELLSMFYGEWCHVVPRGVVM